MGIIAWIAVGLTAGLLANILPLGKRPRGLILIRLTCLTGALGGAWPPASSARTAWPASSASPHGLLSSPNQRSCCWPATCSPGSPADSAGSRAAGTSSWRTP